MPRTPRMPWRSFRAETQMLSDVLKDKIQQGNDVVSAVTQYLDSPNYDERNPTHNWFVWYLIRWGRWAALDVCMKRHPNMDLSGRVTPPNSLITTALTEFSSHYAAMDAVWWLLRNPTVPIYEGIVGFPLMSLVPVYANYNPHPIPFMEALVERGIGCSKVEGKRSVFEEQFAMYRREMVTSELGLMSLVEFQRAHGCKFNADELIREFPELAPYRYMLYNNEEPRPAVGLSPVQDQPGAQATITPEPSLTQDFPPRWATMIILDGPPGAQAAITPEPPLTQDFPPRWATMIILDGPPEAPSRSR